MRIAGRLGYSRLRRGDKRHVDGFSDGLEVKSIACVLQFLCGLVLTRWRQIQTLDTPNISIGTAEGRGPVKT